MKPLKLFLPWGHMGVQIFFVLSGFLITSILLECREHHDRFSQNVKGTLSAFYARRFLRIFPIYYLTIFLVYVLDSENFRDVLQYHLFFLSNLPSAIHEGPMASGPLRHAASAHFWSLAVEEQFYLFWPLLVLSLSRAKLTTVLLGLILIAPLFRFAMFVIGFPGPVGYLPAHMDALGAGALLALIRSGWCAPPPMKVARALLAFAAAMFTICTFAWTANMFYRPFWVVFPFAESVLYCPLIWGVITDRLPSLSKLLSLPFLVSIGKVSYAIYLLHTFVANFVKLHIVDVSKDFPLLQTVIAILATILVARVSWIAFERPINALKIHFPYFRPKPQTAI